ncbi:hypothetical protein TorRG33x02_077130 [Trema orientale]|uniref:Uncharacterized protein n=1 Tax=Trema orientale TaxID=63057 RepID=A0A2P5FF68_TREOI|nr:hypothetical protein TorRG33x02_077130 [Trema orientale]
MARNIVALYGSNGENAPSLSWPMNSSDGIIFLLCMIFMSFSVISFVIFVCGRSSGDGEPPRINKKLSDAGNQLRKEKRSLADAAREEKRSSSSDTHAAANYAVWTAVATQDTGHHHHHGGGGCGGGGGGGGCRGGNGCGGGGGGCGGGI